MHENDIKYSSVLLWTGLTILLIFVVIALSVLGAAGCKAFNRAQARANAHNAVSITDIQVQNQKRYAEVIRAHNATIQAQAEQRVIEARGIRAAQDEISRTLTPFYLQHEAIQALQATANSGSDKTVVYVPAGANGVPLVQLAGKP